MNTETTSLETASGTPPTLPAVEPPVVPALEAEDRTALTRARKLAHEAVERCCDFGGDLTLDLRKALERWFVRMARRGLPLPEVRPYLLFGQTELPEDPQDRDRATLCWEGESEKKGSWQVTLCGGPGRWSTLAFQVDIRYVTELLWSDAFTSEGEELDEKARLHVETLLQELTEAYT